MPLHLTLTAADWLGLFVHFMSLSLLAVKSSCDRRGSHSSSMRDASAIASRHANWIYDPIDGLDRILPYPAPYLRAMSFSRLCSAYRS